MSHWLGVGSVDGWQVKVHSFANTLLRLFPWSELQDWQCLRHVATPLHMSVVITFLWMETSCDAQLSMRIYIILPHPALHTILGSDSLDPPQNGLQQFV